jgi:4-hydroxybenzoate polyprenyltransferase
LFAVLIILALVLLSQLPSRVWPWSIPAAALTVVYPFVKRFFHAPQLVLGMAFSFSIPMVYVAFGHEFDKVFWLLVLANLAWVVAYDSAYAMSDREDDLKINVRSTAILFGRFDRLAILILQALVLTLLMLIGFELQLGDSYYIALVVAATLFAYQQWLIRDRDRDLCFHAFLNNGWLGGLVWFGLVLGSF